MERTEENSNTATATLRTLVQASLQYEHFRGKISPRNQADPNRSMSLPAKQKGAKQNKTKQNETKQSKANQSKPKQSKTRQRNKAQNWTHFPNTSKAKKFFQCLPSTELSLRKHTIDSRTSCVAAIIVTILRSPHKLMAARVDVQNGTSSFEKLYPALALT